MLRLGETRSSSSWCLKWFSSRFSVRTLTCRMSYLSLSWNSLNAGFLAELAPHGVKHHFGQCAQTRISLDVVGIESNFLSGIVVLHVLPLLVRIITYVGGLSTSFFLDFEPRVDISGKEALLFLREMPHFMNVDNFFTPSPRPLLIQECTMYR